MMYRYFVYYTYIRSDPKHSEQLVEGDGNRIVETDMPLVDSASIRRLEATIKRDNDLESILLSNFILLGDKP